MSTREQWLNEAIVSFRPWFRNAGKTIPDSLRVSVGFPLGNRKAIGQCWFEDTSADNSRNIFISPVLNDVASETGVLATLLHECAHSALPIKSGHRSPFAKLCGNLGLVGPWTSTKANPELCSRLSLVAAQLGDYPHAALTPSLRKKMRKNPYHKVLCGTCSLIVYITPKMLAQAIATAAGDTHCPACQASGWGMDGVTQEDPEED